MIDSETKFEGIEFIETNKIIYKFTLINLSVQNVDTTQFKLALWPGILSTIKISSEMKKLREEPVGEDELKLVKNYMLGALLGDLDGPFQIISRWKSYLLNDLTADYFYNTIQVVREVQPEQILALANTYLKEEDFYELVVY